MLPNKVGLIGSRPPKKETALRNQYPPLTGVSVSSPCIIVDMHGVILAWYLPGILDDSRRVGLFTLSVRGSKSDSFQGAIMEATKKLHPLLEMSKTRSAAATRSDWRNKPKYFRRGTEVPPGSVTLSPAWFPQGHDVSASANRHYYVLSIGSSFRTTRTTHSRQSVEISSRQLPSQLRRPGWTLSRNQIPFLVRSWQSFIRSFTTPVERRSLA